MNRTSLAVALRAAKLAFLAGGSGSSARMLAFAMLMPALMASGTVAQCATHWLPLGAGLNDLVLGLTTLPNGNLVAGGYFTTAGGVAANRIARWNGTAWAPLGSGTNDIVFCVMALPNGDLIAGGPFTTAGGVAANYIARWNGTAWSPLGTGTNGSVAALTTLPNGDLVAGGAFTTAGGVAANRIARWNGTAWSPLGTGMTNGVNPAVLALTTLPNGDLVAGGLFATAGGVAANYIARWNGTAWSPLGTGMSDRVNALTTLPNGDLVVGGFFTWAGGVAANRIARWNGTAWAPLGTGVTNGTNPTAFALTTLPNGDLVAGGSFTTAGGVAANRIARWNGTAWAPLGTGMTNGAYPAVFALTTLPDGDLVAGGAFTTAGGLVSANFARWTTTCPATAVASGTGCAGTGGPMVLSAIALPWLGGIYRYRCSGMAAGSVGFGLFGLAAHNTLLSSLCPAGGAGCSLLATTDAVTLLLPVAGAVGHQFTLPANPAFVGVVLHNQVLQLELGPASNIAWLGSSNALVLTTGLF